MPSVANTLREFSKPTEENLMCKQKEILFVLGKNMIEKKRHYKRPIGALPDQNVFFRLYLCNYLRTLGNTGPNEHYLNHGPTVPRMYLSTKTCLK